MTEDNITTFDENTIKQWIEKTRMVGHLMASGLERHTKLIVGNLL